MKAIEVLAINNEKMYLPTTDVRMVGPLMDRGMAMLGRAVLYIEGLPPLPVKASRRDIVALLGWEVENVVVDEGSPNSGGTDGSADGGPETRLVVEA